MDPANLADLVIPDATPIESGVASSVVYIDTFGNCKLAGLRADLEGSAGPMRPRHAPFACGPATDPSSS